MSETYYGVDWKSFQRQIDEQKERDKDYKYPFKIVNDKSVPPDTLIMFPSHLNLTLVGDKLKVPTDVINRATGERMYRDLTDGEKKQFGGIKF